MSRATLRTALTQTLASVGLPEPPGGVALEPPKRRDQGDWSTPVALQLAKAVGAKPLDVAKFPVALPTAGGLGSWEWQTFS